MLSLVERTVRERRLFSRGARLLVAVSGGADSMALLHALWELRERWALSLEVATIDHGLRAASAGEAAFVEAQAAALGLPCQVLALGLGALARPPGTGIMAFAREHRRAALSACARRCGAEAVALGHHADDQIETVLFRLVRGTGLRGLSGIPYAFQGFVRPLLDVRREALRDYLRARSIPWREDPSNADPRFARSRVRHQLLPLLAAENPRFGEALLALAAEVSERLPRAPRRGDAGAASDVGRAGRWRETLEERGLHASRAAWLSMIQAADEGGTRSFDLQGGRAEIRYGELVVPEVPRARAQREEVTSGAERSVTIEGPGEVRFGAHVLWVREVEPAGTAGATFDAETVPFPWTVRTWHAGDRMRPRGGAGSRKLSDLFIDARIPRPARSSCPLVLGRDGTILFVPGLRPAEHGRPTATSRRVLLVETTHDGSRESSR